MKMKQDRQPRRASKDVSVDKLHPASDMGKRAKGGDKESNQGLPRRQKSSGAQTTPSRKP
jgi:hypothetical protein